MLVGVEVVVAVVAVVSGMAVEALVLTIGAENGTLLVPNKDDDGVEVEDGVEVVVSLAAGASKLKEGVAVVEVLNVEGVVAGVAEPKREVEGVVAGAAVTVEVEAG